MIITTSAALRIALPIVGVAHAGLYVFRLQKTLGAKLKASYATGSNTLLAVGIAGDNEIAANLPLWVAHRYQHDLSKRSRVLLELSSVDPDIAGLDASIEGGGLNRHDW